MTEPLRTTNATAGGTVRTGYDDRRHSGAQQATTAETANSASYIGRSHSYTLGPSETTGQRISSGVAADPTNRDTSSDIIRTGGDSVRTDRDNGAHQATPTGAPCTTPRTGCARRAPDAPPTHARRTIPPN
ncbi:hypothetical protein, partial [Nocardia beijingensis]